MEPLRLVRGQKEVPWRTGSLHMEKIFIFIIHYTLKVHTEALVCVYEAVTTVLQIQVLENAN